MVVELMCWRRGRSARCHGRCAREGLAVVVWLLMWRLWRLMMIAGSRRRGPFVPKRPQLVRGTKGSSVWWKRSLRQWNMISVDRGPVRLGLRPNTLIVALIDSIRTVELRKSMWTRWIHAWDSGIHFRGRRHWFSRRSMSSRICIMSRWFLPGRWLSLRGGFHRVPRIIRFCRRRRLRRVLDLSNISRPVSHAGLGA